MKELKVGEKVAITLEVDNKQLVKIVAWYDNEMSYTAQMVRTAKYLMNE